jgi:hypothetical protein
MNVRLSQYAQEPRKSRVTATAVAAEARAMGFTRKTDGGGRFEVRFSRSRGVCESLLRMLARYEIWDFGSHDVGTNSFRRMYVTNLFRFSLSIPLVSRSALEGKILCEIRNRDVTSTPCRMI